MAACETFSKTVSEAITYISQHYMNPISLVDVAESVHLNEEYFSRLFKKEVGINFTDYLLNLRMEKAHSLLMTTDLKIASVAEKVGISDSKYFSLLFKKTFDQTPSQVRDRQ
jgi:YesN/AraC family two-component response regulator